MNKSVSAPMVVLFLVWGCSLLPKKEQKPAIIPRNHAIIFIDKTQSVDVNRAFVAQKYQQAIRDLVQENIRQRGDQLEIYFIHENTSKARALSLTCQAELENTQNLSPTDQEAARTIFDMALKRQHALFLNQSLAKLNLRNEGISNQMTDIWASLPIIAKAAAADAQVNVYYLSDMIESVRGAGRRDFHVRAPQDNAQAQEWAETDAKKLQENSLNAAQIKIFLPFEATASTRQNNPTVTHYWQTLLQELGAATVEER